MGFLMVPLLALLALRQEIFRSFRRLGSPTGRLFSFVPVWSSWAPLVCSRSVTISIAARLSRSRPRQRSLWLDSAWRFRRTPGPIVLSARPVYERRTWIKAAFPLFLVSGFIVILQQADIVMVGAILGDRAAGLYGAAAKTASLVGLILIAVNAIGAPMLSALFAQDRHDDLQQLASAIAAWAFWPSCLLSIILAACAPLVLTTFGPAFLPPSGSCASFSSARSSMPPLARSGG